MTSLNNPVNLPLDTNGYVKSSIWGQNMNPNVNNVAGSVSGSVASVTGAVGSVTNPVTSWITISHQTGLSATVSAVNSPVNIGSAITITKDGRVQMAFSGHVSAGVGGIRIARTRGGVTDYINQEPGEESSTVMNGSLFSDGIGTLTDSYGIQYTARVRLNKTLSNSTTKDYGSADVLVLDVLNGDTIQLQLSNNTANDTTYIDEWLVQQQ